MIQAIPEIAKQASHLYVLQRTPGLLPPGPRMLPCRLSTFRIFAAGIGRSASDEIESPSGWVLARIGEGSALDVSEEERLQRVRGELGRRWSGRSHSHLRTSARSEEANRTAADFVRRKIAETVADPEMARLLMPIDYPIGAKRVCLDTDYYATYNRDNVSLIDVRSNPITRIVESGIELQSGLLKVDCIVFASGFDAMTGALLRLEPAWPGRSHSLREVGDWAPDLSRAGYGRVSRISSRSPVPAALRY